MNLLLVRIDDRLIHGQVSVGWANRLRPELIVVLDDEAAADSWEGDLLCSACPEAVEARVYGVRDGTARLLGGEFGDRKLFVLLRLPRHAREMVEAGLVPPEINVGGVHHHEGSRSFLPYVYLDDADLADLEAILARGVRLVAQDLPANRAVDLSSLIHGRAH